MRLEALKNELLRLLAFPPTADQSHAIDELCRFLYCPDPRAVMILRGSAGTGKTTLAAAIVRLMVSIRHRVMLLAPTGRAAKVFALASGHPAFTIHRRIYQERAYAGVGGEFALRNNLHQHTLFMADEASMIDHQLLRDLLRFVYGGSACRLILIGDSAQLPPVGSPESPALAPDELAAHGLTVFSATLDEVLRQSQLSGILFNATAIRRMITHDQATQLPLITFHGFADISVVRGDDLIEQLSDSYAHVGLSSSIVITRSNKRANIYNEGIRRLILGREEELSSGDQLMVVRNNYSLSQNTGLPQPPPKEGEASALMGGNGQQGSPSLGGGMGKLFIANGDIVSVRRVRNIQDLYGFRFADATLVFADYDGFELDAKVILSSLHADAPALSEEQMQQLYDAVMADYADLPHKADRLRSLRDDQYFNALQVKYAYAITCHKAQGGQWQHVYLDQGYMTDDMLTPDYIHWLYTAFTRATEHLFLVNWPKEQCGEV